MIIGNNFTFNKLAIYLLNVNDTIISNNINNDKTIVMNGSPYYSSITEILINGSFLNLSYNHIFNNTETFSIANSNIIANLNWWGTNTPFTKYDNITINSWHVLRLFADDFTTIKNDSIVYDDRFNVTLRYELSTNIPVDHDPSYLPMFIVTVYGPNGERIVGDIRNTSLSFFIEGNASTHSIRSLFDNEDVILSVKFPERPKPPNSNPDPNPVPNQPNVLNTNQKNENIANASMKPTGIRLIGILLVLLSICGIAVKKQ